MDKNKLYIVGKAGSGKSYIADILKSTYNYKSIKITQPLYDLVTLIKNDCLIDSQELLKNIGFDDITAKEIVSKIVKSINYNELYSTKPRHALQTIGDIIRSYNENILIVNAYNNTNKYDRVIIEDVRLVREANFFNSKNFLGIKVCADYKTRVERLKKRDGAYNIMLLGHKTETEVDKINEVYTIYNGRGIDKENILVQFDLIKEMNYCIL